MGDMKTGSVGKSASEVQTTSIPSKGGDADTVDSADEQTEKQSKTVEGPTEATSADTELEGKNA